MATITGQNLLVGFSRFLDDYETGTTTSAGDSTSLIDTALARFGTDRLVGRWVRILDDVNGNQYLSRRVTANTQSSGDVTTTAFAGTTGSGTGYEIHKYEPIKKVRALNAARLVAIDYLYQLVLDDTITSDGKSHVYDLPSSITQGPLLAYVEHPIATEVSWNFIQDPIGDSTSNWTASNTTASTVSRNDYDLLIPKYDQTCTKLATATGTNGTYRQPVASMTNSITAALAGGRRMAFAAWVYCRTASRVTTTLEDDTDETSSAAHGGSGWELLVVEKEIADANATTLTAGFDISNASGAVDMWWNRAWLYFGDKERVADAIYAEQVPFEARIDATAQHVLLGHVPPRGYQVRLQGRDALSSLGETVGTLETNTMELDAQQAEVLYAFAAEILFQYEQINTENIPQVAARIGAVKSRLGPLRQNWSMEAPSPHLRSPFGF